MTALVLASIISDASDIIHAGLTGVLAIVSVVLGVVVVRLYGEKEAMVKAHGEAIAKLQAQRVADAQEATKQLTERHDGAVGVATLCVEALNRNVEGFESLGERFRVLETTDHQTHGLIKEAMGKLLERIGKRA